MTDARACCCNDDPDPKSCPAPCLRVILAGVNQQTGGRDSQCWFDGGAPAIFATPVDGSYLLTLQPGRGYIAEIPVMYADIQSGGGQQSSIEVGGILTITAGRVVCENGVITQVGNMGAVIRTFGTYWDDTGNFAAGPGSKRVFSASGGPLFPDTPYENNVTEGCSANGTHFGGQMSFNQPTECVLPPTYNVARSCLNGVEEIVFDAGTLPDDSGIIRSVRHDGELWGPTNRKTLESPVPVEFVPDPCTADLGYVLARFCENTSVTITIDPSTLGPNDITCLLSQSRFIITQEPSNQSPVAVIGSVEACDVPGVDARVARLCFRSAEIAYDRALMPAGSRTCLWLGRRYKLTTVASSDEPLGVIFNNFSCLGTLDCSIINDPDDPLCHDPFYRNCPGCLNDRDIGPPNPRPHGPESNTPDESPGLLPFGNILKRGIKLVTVGKLEGCSACEKRRVILNRFGNKLGRKMIKTLEKMGLI